VTERLGHRVVFFGVLTFQVRQDRDIHRFSLWPSWARGFSREKRALQNYAITVLSGNESVHRLR
jgi:hypothetical protein